MAKTDTKPAKQNMTTLLRDIRNKLKGLRVEKVEGELAYLIEGKALVEMNYYCGFIVGNSDATKEKKSKECLPSSVTVRADTAKFSRILYGNDSQVVMSSAIFRTRTIPKRRSDNTINTESIAVAVTKCIQGFDKYLVERKALAEKNIKIRANVGAAMSTLRKSLGKSRFLPHGSSHLRGCKVEGAEHRVTIEVNQPREPSDPITYDVHLDYLTEEQLKLLTGPLMALTQ